MNSSTVFTSYINSRGEEFWQLFQWFPSIQSLYLDVEKEWDPDLRADGSSNRWIWNANHVPIIAVALYLAFCYYGTLFMKRREPLGLQGPLALWNLGLALFSAAGALRTAPHLLWMLRVGGFRGVVCTVPSVGYGSGAAGLWTRWFIVSKIPELVDTVFIVLRKKPLIFLHWYHHVTVLLYCWHSYVTESSMGIFFVAMNYSVHAVMYFYYFLAAAKLQKPRWLKPIYITIAQTSQMFVGVAVCVGVYLIHSSAPAGTCRGIRHDNLVAAAAMYASYFALFFKLAWDRYGPSNKKQKLKTK
ncbi:unnamed protein product [Heterosigma akashiwo]